MKAVEALTKIIEFYEELLDMCYRALSADTPQQDRDRVRKGVEAINQDTEDESRYEAVNALNSLTESYNKLLGMCYQALSADTPQEERDRLRKSMEFTKQKTEYEPQSIAEQHAIQDKSKQQKVIVEPRGSLTPFKL